MVRVLGVAFRQQARRAETISLGGFYEAPRISSIVVLILAACAEVLLQRKDHAELNDGLADPAPPLSGRLPPYPRISTIASSCHQRGSSEQPPP